MLDAYTYVFVIGTLFALLDAYNNGANDVANAWATSVSSRSITYRQAMVLGAIFEMLGAITVGARTADTIKNGIIPNDAFRGNAGVQMLAFTCALAAASSWVMWCTKHSAHVSSTYSLISAVAGVGVATVGAAKVQWGWNGGKGLGAIFAGLGMAPAISGGFAASIFLLIKFIVHARKEPVKWAVYTSPFWFLLAGTICTLSIVYKGSPNLGLNKKPAWYVAAVTMGTGGGVAVLAALFFVPYVYAKVIVKDHSVKWYHVPLGPLLYRRAAPAEADRAAVPNYAVIQDDDEDQHSSTSTVAESVSGDHSEKTPAEDTERTVVTREVSQATYKELVGQAQERLHQKIMKGRGPLAWALRYLRANRMGAGELYEPKNIMIVLKRIPAQIVVGALYGLHYDIHAAQSGIAGTPEGARMARVYAHAEKYPNEVEHTYSFVQVLTACTASFAHGANDIGNSVGPWAVIYSAWSTGSAAASKAPVPIWQLAVLSAAISVGLVTYGYNIMKVMGNKITYHSPSRGCSMEMGAAITVLVFSQYSLPVSTSMCITGATVGVGLCNGTFKAVNFQRVGLLVLAWVMTIPIAGTLGGRAKTIPAKDGKASVPIKLAIYSCSNYPFGFFNAYGNSVRKDSVIHLGDYIYEYKNGDYGWGDAYGRVPQPDHEIHTLYDYRKRIAQYPTDLDLVASHQQFPWIPVWDDHEVADNTWKSSSSHLNNTEESFVEDGGVSVDQRKMNAVRAYFEWMPIRQVDMDNNLGIWRNFQFGDLFDLLVLDTRQYDRSITDLYWNTDYVHAISNETSRSLMGPRQEQWFYRMPRDSSRRGTVWRVVGNQIVFSRMNESLALGEKNPLNYDSWDGYLANRNRTFANLYENQINNTIFLAGDSHASWVSDLVWLDKHAYDTATGAGSIGVEFAGTAVSSPCPAGQNISLTTANAGSSWLVAANRELQWQDLYYRGYYELSIGYDAINASFYGVPSTKTRNGYEISLSNFTVKAGENKLHRSVSNGLVESGALKGGKVAGTNLTHDTGSGKWFVFQEGTAEKDAIGRG